MALQIPGGPAAPTAMTCVALLFYIVGMSTDHWIDVGVNHGGLFEACVFNEENGFPMCFSISTYIANAPGYTFIKAVQAMIILGMLSALLACAIPVVSCFYYFGLWKPLPHGKLLHYMCLVAAIATATFACIGIIVLLCNLHLFNGVDYNLSYSFAFVIMGALGMIGGGGLFVGTDTERASAEPLAAFMESDA